MILFFARVNWNNVPSSCTEIDNIMASIAALQDNNLRSLVEDEEEEEEEEVVVKSKPKPYSQSSKDTLSDDPPLPLEDHIDHPPPNGGLPPPMLEVADRQSRGSSTTPLVWDNQGEFGLSGQFKILGKHCTLRLEDDALQWSVETKKGIVYGKYLVILRFFGRTKD